VARQIIIDFDPDPDDRAFSKAWFFSEELYGLLRSDGWGSIPIEDIDKATRQLKATVHSKRRVRRISDMIARLLERRYLNGRARISVIAPAD
jgi:hypothetical protein